MKPTNWGYIMMGQQSGKGVIATPEIAVPYLDEGFDTNQQGTRLKSGQDNEYLLENVKMEHKESFSYTINARPDIFGYLGYYMLGDTSITGSADPYTKTITRNERQWLTVERQLSTTVFQRLVDCKIESMTIAGEAGQPVKISVDGNALTATMRTTAQTPSYDTEKPYMYYHGGSRFNVDGSTDQTIKSFEIRINVNSGGGLKDDRYEFIDFPDFNYSVDCTLELYTTDLDRFKKINYNASTVPQGEFSTGSFEIDCQYTSTSTRQMKITVPYLTWESIGGVNLNPEGSTMTETIAGPAMKQATTELMTIVSKSGANTDSLEDNDDAFLLDNDGQRLIGVY